MDIDKVIDDVMEQFYYNHTDPSRKFDCVICGKHCHGMGNDAKPVKEGRCCDECNSKIVVPARIRQSNWAD